MTLGVLFVACFPSPVLAASHPLNLNFKPILNYFSCRTIPILIFSLFHLARRRKKKEREFRLFEILPVERCHANEAVTHRWFC